MKYLILGSRGMLGKDLMKVFSDKNPVGWDQSDVDITKEKETRDKILNLKPAVIINAAAYTNVDGAETNQNLANEVNGKAVATLAKAASEIKAILIYYSTDYVFDGQKKEGYQENDQPDPVNAYGQSKFLGEEAIQNNMERYYLIRTSWLFGKNGKNFVDTMINLGKTQKEVKVVNDQFGKPTYTVDLAKRTRELVEAKKEYGIYHITNEGITSWYDFTKEIFRLEKINTRLLPVVTDQFPRPAKRPSYSILINTKLFLTRPWQEALKEYLVRLR